MNRNQQQLTREEIQRERNRLKKQLSRQRQKESGCVVDVADKRRNVIHNICQGIKVRSNLKELGITINMIPCDESQIHPEILRQLKGEEKTISSMNIPKSVSGISQEKTLQPAISTKIQVRIKKPIIKISQSEINYIFDQLAINKQLSKRTCDNYKDNIGIIIDVMKCSNDDIISCLRRTEQLFVTLHERYPKTTTYKNLLSPILSLAKFNETIKKELTQSVIDRYHEEMNRLREIVTHQEEEKVDHGSVKPWSEFVELRRKLSENELNGFRYLILCLYTMIPPMRDNFGKIYLIDETSATNLSTEQFLETEQNIYFVREGRLLITQYKTEKFGGIIDIILPRRLQGIISRSLMHFPRQYLVTQEKSKSHVYDEAKGGKLSSIMTGHFFGFSINDLRHSMETYVEQHKLEFTCAEIKTIRYIMGHGAEMGDMYARHASNPSKSYISQPTLVEVSMLESIFEKIGGNQ